MTCSGPTWKAIEVMRQLLAAWMRPGIAAAALVAAAAGWWLTTGTRTDIASTTPVEVFAAGGGTDVMLASALEAR